MKRLVFSVFAVLFVLYVLTPSPPVAHEARADKGVSVLLNAVTVTGRSVPIVMTPENGGDRFVFQLVASGGQRTVIEESLDAGTTWAVVGDFRERPVFSFPASGAAIFAANVTYCSSCTVTVYAGVSGASSLATPTVTPTATPTATPTTTPTASPSPTHT
jgi:hypothetical protein